MSFNILNTGNAFIQVLYCVVLCDFLKTECLQKKSLFLGSFKLIYKWKLNSMKHEQLVGGGG